MMRSGLAWVHGALMGAGWTLLTVDKFPVLAFLFFCASMAIWIVDKKIKHHEF